MFSSISKQMSDRMAFLEAQDIRDRNDGTPHSQRLRQIPPDSGRYLAILASSAPAGQWVEVGTGAGYSAMWLSLACREKKTRLTTFELSPAKTDIARETIKSTGIGDWVELVQGDALSHIPTFEKIAFAFLDAERSILERCYELILERMVPGGLLCADNVISHKHEIEDFLKKIPSDTRMDSVIVPIGSGILTCRKPY